MPTQTRNEILAFLRTYIAVHGWSPTLSEICDNVGLASPNAARKHLIALQEQGFLKMEPNRTGRITMTSPAPDGWEKL